MMNKKRILIGALVIVIFTISGFIGYRLYKNTPAQKQASTANQIEDYYKTKPRAVSEEDIKKGNSELTKAPADSPCGKLGFEYQVKGPEGTAVCTEGFH